MVHRVLLSMGTCLIGMESMMHGAVVDTLPAATMDISREWTPGADSDCSSLISYTTTGSTTWPFSPDEIADIQSQLGPSWRHYHFSIE